MRPEFSDLVVNLKTWMTLFGPLKSFDSDIGKGLWVKITPGMALVLSTKKDVLFVQLIRNTRVQPRGNIRCVRGVTRRVDDAFPCIKHHITVQKRSWNKRGYLHVSIYDDGSSAAMKMLFDMYYFSCFPKGHSERLHHPTNFRTRVVHIYMLVDDSGKNIRISSTHPEGKCFALMDDETFAKNIFEVVRRGHQNVDADTLSDAWKAREKVMQDLRTLMNVFGHAILPITRRQKNYSRVGSK